MSVISTLIAPYRLYAEIALCVVAVGAAALWWHEHNLKEQAIGEAKIVAVDAEAVKKQAAHDTQLHAEEIKEVTHEADTYHEAITAPIATAPVLRLCQPAKPSANRSVPSAGTAGPVVHEEAAVRSDDQSLPAITEWNTEPIVRAGRDADAQVTALQSYISNVCQKR